MDARSTDSSVESAIKPSRSTYLSGWRLGMVIASLYLGTFTMAVDTSIINIAVPKISADFNALEEIAWYGAAYLLTITAFQPTFGSLYKFFDITNTYRACIVVFEIGSVLSAAAVNSPMFIFGRAVAGIGAAGLLQGSLSIIGHVVELEKRPLFMGIVISVFVVSSCIGPVLGGALTTHTTWRWCFWINLPIGAVVLVLLFLFLRIRDTDNENRRLPLKAKLDRMDPLGTLFFISAVTCILLALQWGGQSKPWSSATIIGLLVGFVALSCAFLVTQWKLGERAIIPLRVMRQRSMLTGSGVLFFLGASTYINNFYIPFWFQGVQGTDAITSGIRFLPLILPQMIALIVTGAIVTKYGHYIPYMIVGEAICLAGTVLMSRIDVDTPTVAWAAFLVLMGWGMGMAMQLPYTAVQIVFDEADVPTGNAIAVFVWQLGGAVAIGAGQSITLSTLLENLGATAPEIPPAAVVAAGAVNLPAIAPSPAALAALRSLWNLAIQRTMIFSFAAVALAVPFTLGMEWLNAKKVSEARKAAAAAAVAEPPETRSCHECSRAASSAGSRSSIESRWPHACEWRLPNEWPLSNEWKLPDEWPLRDSIVGPTGGPAKMEMAKTKW